MILQPLTQFTEDRLESLECSLKELLKGLIGGNVGSWWNGNLVVVPGDGVLDTSRVFAEGVLGTVDLHLQFVDGGLRRHDFLLLPGVEFLKLAIAWIEDRAHAVVCGSVDPGKREGVSQTESIWGNSEEYGRGRFPGLEDNEVAGIGLVIGIAEHVHPERTFQRKRFRAAVAERHEQETDPVYRIVANLVRVRVIHHPIMDLCGSHQGQEDCDWCKNHGFPLERTVLCMHWTQSFSDVSCPSRYGPSRP
jgi:hypothetical protein